MKKVKNYLLNLLENFRQGMKYEDLRKTNKQLRQALDDEQKLTNKLSNEIIDYKKKLRELKNKVSELKKEDKEPVMDSEYWNNKWRQKRIYYDYGEGDNPIDLLQLSDEERDYLRSFVDDIKSRFNLRHQIEDNNNLGKVPISVFKWRMDYFDGNEGYILDKNNYDDSEYWATPVKTLETKEYDCDDIMIVEYALIKMIFEDFNLWNKVRHRLKCVAGNVNNWDGIHAGGHAYLIWLADDGRWYPIETTYYIDRAEGYWMEDSVKDLPVYGTIWFTFNDKLGWSQFDVRYSRKQTKKLSEEDR